MQSSFTKQYNTEGKEQQARAAVTDLILGACTIFGSADHHVNVAALARLVQMLPDGEHSPCPFPSTLHPKCGEHPIHHLDIALELHRHGTLKGQK